MGLRINTNLSALNAHGNMAKIDNALTDSLGRLSSGLRINKAADDASGMAIADSLKSQSMGLGQAIRNANDGISMVQTADGALGESIKIVNTIKAKAIQAAQDGQTMSSRMTIQADINSLMEELDVIAKTTSFNGQKLLSGQFTNKRFQVGAFSGETVSISIGSAESAKVGHVTTGVLKTDSAGGGEVRLKIYSNTQSADIAIQSVNLAYDNSKENSMGALADAINKVSDLTGVTAQAKVEVTSNSAVAAGATGGDFAINGITIGAITVRANDANGSLASAINSKSAQHGVVASIGESGLLTLTSKDGRAIQVGGDTGTTLLGSDLSTFGKIMLFQAGANDIQVSDETDMVSLNLTASLAMANATTTMVDSTLARGTFLGSSTVLAAGSTLGFTLTDDTTIAVTMIQDSLLKAGSVLGSSSMVKKDTILGGPAVLSGNVGTTGDSLLRTGSILAGGTVLAAGTTITTRLTATTGIIEAGTTLASDITLAGPATLFADMTVKKESVLNVGSTLQAGSYAGGDIYLGDDMTLTVDMTLKKESIIALSGTNTSILAGSTIGANITLSSSGFTVTRDMTLEAGSVIGGDSVLAKGSTLGGNVTLSTTPMTLGGDMTLAAGSMLASDSVLKAGTVLTNDIQVQGGDWLKAGTMLIGDAVTMGDNYLSRSMTLKADSVLMGSSILAATATSSSGGSATTSISDIEKYALSDMDVTTQEGAQVAITIADAALKDLDKSRSGLGSTQNQLVSTISNLTVTKTNLLAAESNIRDVDLADEVQNFSRLQLLAQAASYALAQANATSQTVLSLLK